MSGHMDVVTSSGEGTLGNEVYKMSSEGAMATEVTLVSQSTPKNEVRAPIAVPQSAGEVTTALSSTPTPIKRKRVPSSTDIDATKSGGEAVVTPAKGQVITTYSEWLSQSKSSAKSSSKSISKANKSVVKASNSAAKAKTTSGKKGRPKAEKSAGTKTPGKKATKKIAGAAATSTPSAEVVKKKRPVKMTANRLKKIQDLTEREKTEKASLEKLKRSLLKLERQLAAEEEVKYPVADETIVQVDRKGSRPSALPEPTNRLNFPPHLMADLLLVWDFLYTFSKEISLKTFELDEFIEVLAYSLEASPVLIETVTALLRTILCDTYMSERLEEEIPRELHYAYRGDLARKTSAFGTNSGSPEVGAAGGRYAHLCPTFARAVESDSSCVTLKLLNARHPLRASDVHTLKWQSILRAVFPRLDSFRDLQRARDIEGDMAASIYEGEGIDGEGHSTPNKDYQSRVMSTDEYTVYPYHSSLEYLNAKLAAGQNDNCETAAAMDVETDTTQASTVPYMELCLQATKELQEKEFHYLSVELKLVVLKNLVLTCYDCEAIQDKVAANAEEKANQIAQNNKLKWEEKKRFREASKAVKDLAIEKCRAINEQQAEKKASRASAGRGKKSVQKKLNFKDAEGGQNKTTEEEGDEGATATGGKRGKGGKSVYDPTPSQLSAMLEDMVMLDSFGIDTVLPTAPELNEVSDNEEEDDDSTDVETKKLIDALSSSGRSSRDRSSGGGVTSRAQVKSSRDRDRDRAQRRAERNAVLKAREMAMALCAQAVQSRRERDVRDAIKASKSSGLQGRLENGDIYVTEELKAVYEVQYQQDAENKEAAQVQKLEKALAELYVRTEPIGQDRYFRSYWCFEGDDRLFVQSERGMTALIKSAVDNGSDVQKVLDDKKKKDSQQPNAISVSGVGDSALLKTSNHPSRHDYEWSVFRSEAELWQLVDALDERGYRERALKNSIKARFDLQGVAPLPSVYSTEGSPYIGMKVKRTFGRGADKYVMVGVITGWLPPGVGEDGAPEPPIWHVLHADGDDEDLDEREVKKCLLGSLPQQQEEGALDDADEGADDKAAKKVTRSLSSNSVTKGSTTEELLTKDIEKDIHLMPYVLAETSEGADSSRALLIKNEFYQPSIVRNYVNTYRGGAALKSYMIAESGLRTSFLNLMNDMLEGLKARGSQWPRSSTKRVWESSVREADTAKAFRSLLIELEAIVRETQKVEDTRQDEELENMRNKVKKRLEDEGWAFSKEQLMSNASYAQTVLDALVSSSGETDTPSGSESPVGSKRTLEEMEGKDETGNKSNSAVSTAVNKGDSIFPAFPLLIAPQELDISSSAMDTIRSDAEGAEFIGVPVRRFFRGLAAPSDGTVVAFLPAYLNDGASLWHVLHDDGDEEDLDRDEVLKGIRSAENDLQSPEMEDDYDGEGEGSENGEDEGEAEGAGEEAEEEGDDEESDDEESRDSFALDPSEDPTAKRLWPSAYARMRWCEAVTECAVLSEVSLALSVLTHQCSEYGVMLPDPATITTKRVSKPVKRMSTDNSSRAAKKRRFSLTPVKPKGSHSRRMQSPNGGPSTPATKKKKKKTAARDLSSAASTTVASQRAPPSSLPPPTHTSPSSGKRKTGEC